MTTILVGAIADTHGLLRPQAREALAGVNLIVHAGDIGGPEVLAGLRDLAPVVAVRGNTDSGWGRALPCTEVVEAGGVLLYLLHDLAALDLDPAAAGFQAVIFGHSHRPTVQQTRGVLFLNPGSAGPRRFHLPVTVARLRIEGGRLTPEIVPLPIG